jgi:predicted DNA-binding antitoxin AbrB/MazE fold protein
MLENITAVYEKGCLRPLHPLNLQENEIVHLTVIPATIAGEREEMIRIMVGAGLMRPIQITKEFMPNPVSEEERMRIAEKLGNAPGKPLSEIIIEERD